MHRNGLCCKVCYHPWHLLNMTFDLVYSSLTLHYIVDFGAVCGTIRRLLDPGGRFVFSIEHPLFTAPRNPEWRTEPDGSKVWPINDYLLEGRRVTEWITPGVVKYHRTIASYVNSLLVHGFSLVCLEEWGPNQEQIAEHPEWADEVHRPPFLFLAARI